MSEKMVLEAYAVYSLKEPDRMSSSSGGGLFSFS